MHGVGRPALLKNAKYPLRVDFSQLGQTLVAQHAEVGTGGERCFEETWTKGIFFPNAAPYGHLWGAGRSLLDRMRLDPGPIPAVLFTWPSRLTMASLLKRRNFRWQGLAATLRCPS